MNQTNFLFNWLKNNFINALLVVVMAYLLSQRIPNWIDVWKLEGHQSKNFSVVVLRPAIVDQISQPVSNSNSVTDSQTKSAASSLKQNLDTPSSKNQNIIQTNDHGNSNQLFIPQDIQKPAVLIFWATWCGPCQIELARVRDEILTKKIPADRVYALSISEDPQLILKTAQERNYPFHLVHDLNGDAFDFYKVRATPTTVFIDQDGKISWIGTGLSPTLGFRIEKHLNKK